MNGACLRVIRAKYQTANAGMNHRSRTHGAWFNCNKQVTAAQPVIAKVPPGRTQRDDFRVCRRIVLGKITVPSLADYRSLIDDYCPHRYLPNLQRSLRASQRFFHEYFGISNYY